MSLFDIFKPQWKKQFEELVSNHREALEAYIRGRYEVYPDMRGDDRTLFKEYQEVYEKAHYAQSVDALSEEDKKDLSLQSDNIIRLFRAFSKYDTKQKRVESLIGRFCVDNIFDTIFGESYILGGKNWKVSDLDETQLDYILNNYDRLVRKANEIKSKKEKSQKKQRDKLLEKVYTRQVDKLIESQRKADAILNVGILNALSTKIIKNKLSLLRQKYQSFNAYNLIRRVLLLGFEDSSKISKDIFVLSRENVFESGSKAFESTRTSFRRQEYLTKYLQTTTDREGCINGLLLKHNYRILNSFIEEQESGTSSGGSTANTMEESQIKATIDKGSIHRSFDLGINKEKGLTTEYSVWQEKQNTFNQSIQDWKMLLKGFYFSNTFTPVSATQGKKNVKKHLAYIHIMEYVYVTSMSNNELGGYINYTILTEYLKYNKRYSDGESTTIIEILNFIDKIYRQLPGKKLAVVVGTSGVENFPTFNSYHLGKLIEDIKLFGIPVVGLNELDSLDMPQYIIILELISNIKSSREIRKEILDKFPGVAFCYLSIYKEKSQSGYEFPDN